MLAIVADDQPIIRQALAMALRDLAGFDQIIEVESGPAALAVATLSIPFGFGTVLPIDLVVMDRNMPLGNGIEALRSMRNVGLETPVIVATGDNSEEARREAFDAGANGYLCKPFAGEALAAEVARVLARKGARGGGDGHPDDTGA